MYKHMSLSRREQYFLRRHRDEFRIMQSYRNSRVVARARLTIEPSEEPFLLNQSLAKYLWP